MTPARPLRSRGTFLLPLVYISSLTLVAVSSVALALLGQEHAVGAAIQVAVNDDRSTVGGFVTSRLGPDEIDSGQLSAARRLAIDEELRKLALDHSYEEIVVLSPAGAVVAATLPAGDASGAIWTGARQALAEGDADAAITEAGATSGVGLLEAIPVLDGRDVRLVFQIRRDASAILGHASGAWRDVLFVTGSAAVILAVLLYTIFRAANVRLGRQELELVEARRRDPLTGLLNHGAVLTMLWDLMEDARSRASSLGIALVDLDNFRLLNEVHGSEAGDQALSIVADALRDEGGPWTALARFGPDEFLAVAPESAARDLPMAMQRVRVALEGVALQLPGSEPLPVTVSTGVAYFPFHASSVNELLSAATIALGDAKAAGGNDLSIANAWSDEPRAPHTTFDVLQGLVIAIDRKDRYTKLHSEDVAAYALFLADKLGLPEDMRASIRIAALIHDVGKIGIPDDILRKPGRLTPYEYEVVKHHVALGDLMVRDLPNVDVIRSGVRFHHERWDGNGYLVGLEGDDIPLIARILAVADTFSAMTTTRPYRKAMSVEKALEELRAAAGTQLDASLATMFAVGIEKDPEAPMPGDDRNSTLLWTPSRAA